MVRVEDGEIVRDSDLDDFPDLGDLFFKIGLDTLLEGEGGHGAGTAGACESDFYGAVLFHGYKFDVAAIRL